MIVEKITKEFEVIISEGKYAFQEVLDDFCNAEYIYIVTYNISKNKKDELLDLLIKYGTSKPVNLVTNIPQRFEKYYTTNQKEEAKKQIKVYKEKLDHRIIGEKFNASFDFNNHMKIVMTNNVAYIGSQNFSQESKNNKECGVIIRNKEEINKLICWLNTYISDNTIQYNKKNIRILYDTLKKIYNKLLIDSQIFIYQVFGDYDRKLGYCLTEDTINIKLSELHDLQAKLDYYYQIISEVYKMYKDDYFIEINTIFNFINKLEDNIKSISINITYLDFIDYDNKLFSDKYALDVYPEDLDNHRNAFDNCRDNFHMINMKLEDIQKQMKELIQECERVLDNYEIDNTK